MALDVSLKNLVIRFKRLRELLVDAAMQRWCDQKYFPLCHSLWRNLKNENAFFLISPKIFRKPCLTTMWLTYETLMTLTSVIIVRSDAHSIRTLEKSWKKTKYGDKQCLFWNIFLFKTLYSQLFLISRNSWFIFTII